jgi:anti-sigma regulatory factor (Ser/Thr protein kinase)
VSTLWVRHAPGSAALARRSVLAAFDDAGLAGEPALYAALIASELVGNAVRHATPLASGRLAVRWTVDPDGYSISVTDGGAAVEPGTPEAGSSPISARQAGSRDVDGRGLRIVAELADSWGVAAEDGATTVWARSHR